MSAIANITVFDGAATPVVHTLTAISVTRDKGQIVALYRELLASVPNYAQVRASATITMLKSGVAKCEWEVVVPVMEAILNQNAAGYTAAPKVAYENTNRWISFYHPRSTVTDRRIARMLLTNISNNVTTTVAAATTGPFSELFDSLVSPT